MIDVNDEIVLARFACGGLSLADENGVLLQCEANPELWRKATVALVEHRRMVSALAEYSAADQKNSHRAAEIQTATKSNLRFGARTMLAAACLLFVVAGSVTIAYRAGQREANGKIADSRELERPIVVYVSQPAAASIDERPLGPDGELLLAASQPMFPPEARAILQGLGFEVEEEAQIRFVDDGDGSRRAIPNRKFQLRHVSYSE